VIASVTDLQSLQDLDVARVVIRASVGFAANPRSGGSSLRRSSGFLPGWVVSTQWQTSV